MNTVKTLSIKDGIIVYVWLLVLTGVEVALIFSHMQKGAAAILLGATTLAKILLIGLYFMHLKFESKVTWILPIIPIIFGLIFVIALFPDMVYKLPLHF